MPVVTGLGYPAMFTVGPDGRIFYSERLTGRVGVFDPATGVDSTYFIVSPLCAAGDQGLWGLALAPGFPSPPSLYAFATRRVADGSCHNQVLRIDGSTPGELTVSVLLSDPYVAGHNGGRVLFGPDGNLYVSTGDGSSTLPTPEQERAQRAVAQDPTSVKGKILRMTPSGAVPDDNPFGNAVFAYGFRNPFGFDFDPSSGQLWVTDNGPDPSYAGDPVGPGPNGGCNDEVNRVVKGANYGWGPVGSCAKPPEAPLNSNQDGPDAVMPALNIEAASGITGARFCVGCDLGADYEGRLFYVDYDYRSGYGTVRAATLSADRMTVVSDAAVYVSPGGSPLSLERGADGAIYYSDAKGIYKLVAADGTVPTTIPSTTTTGAPSPPTTVGSTTTTISSTAPANLTVTGRTASTVGLRWDPVAGASEYRAYVSDTSGSGYILWASG
ncbi:MAG TPA: PQQ-dependent sugar dehydrogenase, partial [Acidimicrobiia bacterium]|nr:PQQ-dependent sugar dehydrogenase [Acidimicrobiia bacterium]